MAMASWQCSCGFTNKPHNEMCGGAGPMGCKSPRPRSASSFGPAGKSFGKGKGSSVSPYGKSFGKGGGGGEWACMACGFSNRPGNEICGGNGPMGCKAPAPGGGGGMQMQRRFSEMPQSFGGGGGGGPWMCPCGFKNSPNNDICGGNGPMGCKAPRQGGGGGYGARVPMMMMQQPMMSMKGGMCMKGGNGKGKSKGKGEWKCEACGFNNKQNNEICGGNGPMGCNAEKPSDWVCECGFINKPHNEQCGGQGPMGCNLPKPE